MLVDKPCLIQVKNTVVEALEVSEVVSASTAEVASASASTVAAAVSDLAAASDSVMVYGVAGVAVCWGAA